MIEPDLPTRDLGDRERETVTAIRARTALVPRVGITLGSGLGGVIDAIDREVLIPTSELPHWPRSTVSGHAGRLALGHWRAACRWCCSPGVAIATRVTRSTA